ncbi:MAG TPA: hypothetical protein VH595_22720 [Verrucomicrobiae bacterium]|nr:hypothetical protein [Verrucomicrobiae bacterium]
MKPTIAETIVGFLLLEGNMKNRYNQKQVKTRFAPVTRFELSPLPPVPFRGAIEGELDHLKARLLKEQLTREPEPALNPLLRRAANDAASLAWFTPFPLLVFPVLLEEKAEAARRQQARQRQIRRRSRGAVSDLGLGL